MITPGLQTFTGYVGSTFDTIITVYPASDASYNWEGNWVSGVNYSIGTVVIGLDNNAYDALKSNISVNPVGDLSGTWSTPLTPMNLNGYSGNIIIVPVAANEYSQAPTLTTPLIIQGVQGTMSVKFVPNQTSGMSPGTLHFYINVTDPSGNVYYYLNGPFIWDSP